MQTDATYRGTVYPERTRRAHEHTACEARAYATQGGAEALTATMSGTLMALAARE